MRILARKGWIAYLLTIIRNTIMGCAGFLLATLKSHTKLAEIMPEYLLSEPAVLIGWALLTIAVLSGAIDLFRIRAHTLYYDQEGVWKEHGILPWTQGRIGMRWEELEQATYEKSVLGWFTNTYNVKLSHKFKREAIWIPMMWGGRKATGIINEQIQDN